MNDEYYLVEGEERKGPYTFNELINADIDIYTELATGPNEEPVYASYLPEFSEYFENQGYIFPTENNIAHPAWRTLAFLIDYIIISTITMFVLVRLGLMTIPLDANLNSIKNLEALTSKNIYAIEACLAAVYLLYNVILESTARGSIGKIICGLKVVDEDGQKLSLVKTFLRNCGALTIFNLVGMIFLIVSFFLRQVRQTWYERLTKTYVIKPEN